MFVAWIGGRWWIELSCWCLDVFNGISDMILKINSTVHHRAITVQNLLETFKWLKYVHGSISRRAISPSRTFKTISRLFQETERTYHWYDLGGTSKILFGYAASYKN